MILLGMTLRKTGFLKKEDFHVVSRLVINVTMPCAIITNLAGKTFDISMLLMTATGLLFGLAMAGVTSFLYRKSDRGTRAFSVINTGGCNVTNFALPLISGFLGPEAIMAASLFDAGNSFPCLGGNYSFGRMIKYGAGFSFRTLGKTLSRSFPFVSYIVMFVLSLLHISLPSPVVTLTGMIGNANVFMAMLMLGIGFNLKLGTRKRKNLIQVLLIRYGVATLASLLLYFILPLPLAWRQTAVLLFFSPVSSAAPSYTEKLEEDYELASVVNSFSILISIIVMTGLLMIMHG